MIEEQKERFIQEGNLLLHLFEFAGGVIPNQKDLKKRWKMVQEDLAEIVTESSFYSGQKPTIKRKR